MGGPVENEPWTTSLSCNVAKFPGVAEHTRSICLARRLREPARGQGLTNKSVLAGKCKAHLLAGQSRGNLRAGSADFPKDTCIFYGIGGLDCPPNQVMAQVVHNAGDCKPVCQQRRSGINELLVIKTHPRQSQAWLRPTVFVEVEVGCLLRHEIRRC